MVHNTKLSWLYRQLKMLSNEANRLNLKITSTKTTISKEYHKVKRYTFLIKAHTRELMYFREELKNIEKEIKVLKSLIADAQLWYNGIANKNQITITSNKSKETLNPRG